MPGWPFWTWTSNSILPAVCGVDWAAGATCETGTQSEVAGGNEAIQLFLDPASFNTTTITATTTSKYALSNISALL